MATCSCLLLLVPLDDLLYLLRQLVGQRRQIEEYAVHIDGVCYLVPYNQLEYLYVAPPLLYWARRFTMNCLYVVSMYI